MMKFYKEIIASVENAGLYQTIALVLFFLFFVSVTLITLLRPKKYFENVDKLPLED